MDYKFFTEKERQYILDFWDLFYNEGRDRPNTNYEKTVPAFNVDFYKNEFKPNFINIDSYIEDLDEEHWNTSFLLKEILNTFLRELNFKDDKMRIARECFGFDDSIFEFFDIHVIDLIEYKFKSNLINNLEDAYNCYNEYIKITGGCKDYLDEYKERVENEIKELKVNNTYDCSIKEREDVLLFHTNSRYMYYLLSKKETKFHKMNLIHFSPLEALYISDVYHEYNDYIRGEKTRNELKSFSNAFLDYYKKENPYLEKNIDVRLSKKTFKLSQSEEYYNKIVEIFELERVFKDDEEKINTFNLLEYKFKVYDEEGLGVYTLEKAYEICKDLSVILEKENAIKVFESYLGDEKISYLRNNSSDNGIKKEVSYMQESKKTKVNIKNIDENNSDSNIDLCSEIFKLITNYITYASSEKIMKIIQYKINNEPINPMHNKTYFVLQENLVKNAAKIGYCFNLQNSEIIHFIRFNTDEDGKKNRKKITKTIPNGKIVKGASELDNLLFTIRNEYLNKINPNVFPLI